MVEWITDYKTPMDRTGYNSPTPEVPAYGKLNEPIFPIQQVGITVPEHDATGRNKNMLQGVQAAIRQGTGTMQIVMQTDPRNAIGGRFKAYGKEVRQTMKEVAEIEGVKLQGVELPTSLSNMNGYDPQQGYFNDEQRKLGLSEVSDAIRFVADIGSAGGVDIVSHEFNRSFSEQGWNPIIGHDSKGQDKRLFQHQDRNKELIQFVDPKDGRIMRLQKGNDIWMPMEPPKTAERAEVAKKYLAGTLSSEEQQREIKLHEKGDKEGLPILHAWKWEDIKKFAKLLPEYAKNPDKALIDLHLQSQIQSSRGTASYYLELARDAETRAGESRFTGDDPNVIQEFKKRAMNHRETAVTHMKQARDQEKLRGRIKGISEYANERTEDSYAQLGVRAWEESMKHPNQDPVHVGPEIGWPTYYGGHPDEFINMVKNSRKQMAGMMEKRLKAQGYNTMGAKKEAQRLAHVHIKGLFDTSHLGMWLEHYKKDLPWDQRVKQFNKWYLKQVQKIVDADVVGDIQLVDTISGAHSHLPPGEGVLPLTEAMRKFKDKGFSGLIVSEGHEEEKFEPGRIQFSAWRAVGANIGDPYPIGGGGRATQWAPLHHNYFGKTYSPMYMVGGYSPSNEFKLWSEVPFE